MSEVLVHYQDYEELKRMMRESGRDYDTQLIEKAYNLASEAHGDQRRVSGVPYILHPTSVACILVDLGMDSETVVAALLHDVVEDTDVTLEEIIKLFGDEIAHLIDGVTKLKKIPYSNREVRQAENIRKMLIAMSDDIRVIIIKLADRLHNMRTIECMREQKRRDIALETMEVFAPIAHRLGIRTVKEEMEDLSLRYLDPIGYKEIEDKLAFSEPERKKFIERIKKEIVERAKGIVDDIYIEGRVKSINGIYKKTFMKGKSIEQIYDIFAVRVIVNTVSDCYNILGVVHDMFKPLPNRFKDYISTPKPNMYQSLHTTVIGKEGVPFEVQIRTWEMHHTAEYGIAAHWKYKLGLKGKSKDDMSEKVQWIRQILENQLDEIKAKELPELDNDFVMDVSDKETVEEYKAQVADELAEKLQKESDADVEKQLIAKLCELLKGEIPEAMYDNKVNDMMREFDMRLRSQGLDMNTYLQYMGMDAEAVKNSYKPEAEKRVKLRLALEKIAQQQGFTDVSDEDLEAEYSRLADTYKMDIDKVKAAIAADELKKDIAVEKAMDFVKESAIANN